MWIRWIRTGFRSGSATLIIIFSSLVKPAANHLKFAVKTGLVHIYTLHKHDQSNLPANWKPCTISSHGEKHSGTVRVVPGKASGDEKGDETEG